MSKTTLSILSSLLLSTALAVPATAASQTRYPLLGRFLAGHALQVELDGHKPAGKNSAGLHPAGSRPADRALTVYDEPYAAGGTWGYAINADGFAVGEYLGSDSHSHGFLRAPSGAFTEINVDTDSTAALWVNDKGTIAGIYRDNGIIEGFVRTPNGKYHKFDGAGGGSAGTFANDINNSGVVTGNYVDANGVWHGFLRAKDGTLTQFDEPQAASGADQGTFSGATNVRGDTTGPYVDENNVLHGYVRHDDTFIEFDVPGAVDTIPNFISAKGWIDGVFDDENGAFHGFIRKPSGKIIVVDAPGAGNGPGQGTFMNMINREGIVAGNYLDANDVSHGFLCCTKDGAIIKEFDARGAGTSPGTGTMPVGINTDGEISGFVVNDKNKSRGIVGVP